MRNLRFLLVASAVTATGCSAASEPTEPSHEEALVAPPLPAIPPAPSVACGGGAASLARPLRSYRLVPETGRLELGQAVKDGRVLPAKVADGFPTRDASAVVDQGYGAGPDLLNLGAWVGALLPWSPADALLTSSNLEGGDVLRAWGDANQSRETRIGFSVVWHQAEREWYLDEEAALPVESDADRYVAWFGAHRWFGATLAFDVSPCAATTLGSILGERPVLRRTAAGHDPVARTLLDPAHRSDVMAVLLSDGASPYVSITSNHARPEVDALVRASTCRADDLAACAKLLDDLGAASRALAAPVAPSRYEDLVAGEGEWAVSAYTTSRRSPRR